MTVFYAGLHFLVDGLCALAMFGIFLPGGRGIYPMLIYNFCAFALQMPMGVLLDALNEKEKGGRKKNFALFAAAAGVVCTVAGLAAGPAVLGTGNALFHVGGGVGTIQEDNEKNWKGRGLGVFVAPGALGLYLGTLAAKQGFQRAGIPGVIAGMLLLGAAIFAGYKSKNRLGALWQRCRPVEEKQGQAGMPWFRRAKTCRGRDGKAGTMLSGSGVFAVLYRYGGYFFLEKRYDCRASGCSCHCGREGGGGGFWLPGTAP